MIKLLLYKWFGIEQPVCNTCEVLRVQLVKSERERSELLARLLQRDTPEPPSEIKTEELRPVTPQFVPWRVRQQMLEGEDRKKAELLKNKEREIEELEKELGVGEQK